MKLIPGKSWVVIRSRDLGPGRIDKLIGNFFRANFLVEDGVEYCCDLIPITDIEKIITNKEEVEMLEKEYKGELELI